MPRGHEPILGRKICAKCGRWRYVATDFSIKLYHMKSGDVEKPIGTCKVCANRKSSEKYNSLSDEEKKDRWTKQNQNRQQKIDLVKEAKSARLELMGYRNGRLVTIVPFRMWLIKKLKVYGSINALREVTGLGHSQIDNYLKGYEWNESLACDPRPVLTIPVSTVDKALTKEGSDSLRGIGYE